MLKPAARRWLMILAAIVLVAALAVGLFAWRLSGGPINADNLRPAVERSLEKQVEGGQANVGHVEIIWFGQARAAGLRLTDVLLEDGRGRPVLKAKVVETGIGTDSLVRLSPAPAHLTLKDFFVAVSVSKQGRYALGYDAAGPPPILHLREVLWELTGKPRRGQPLSFVRHVDLDHGEMLLRQAEGPVRWTAQVDKVAFHKSAERFDADVRLVIDDGEGKADLRGRARGLVGLRALTTSGSATGLVPARVFPTVGFTRRLSLIDAPVEGKARVEYAADQGVTAAEVSGHAGEGTLRLGPVVQPMQGAELVTRYDPVRKQVVLEAFRLEAERTQLDISGRAWLKPETGRQPARIEYRLTSAESLIAAEPTATPQHLRDLTLNGSITPEEGRFEVSDLRVRLGDAPVRGHLLIWRGRDAKASPGIKGELTVGGPISIQSVYAFWPDEIAGAARAWIVPRLRATTVTRSSVEADIPPGRLDKRRLENRMLKVAFAYEGGELRLTPDLPGIEGAAGSGLVEGDRLELKTSSARLAGFAIRDASITVPRFDESADIAVKSRVAGDLGDMLRLVGSPPMNMMASSNMSPDRFSGPADLTIEIRRPLRAHVEKSDYKVSFEGELTNLTIKDVTLGEDLTRARMTTHGTLEFVEAEGTGYVGPFSGGLSFRMPMRGPEKGRKYIKLDGRVSLAGVKGAPFRGAITTKNGVGGGTFRSGVFEGRSDWRKGERMLAAGFGRPEAWRRAGIPSGPDMPDRVPVKIAMTANGPLWSGGFEAGPLSGALSYDRNERVARYAAEITPQEADLIGLGDLPMFAQTRKLDATLRLQETTGSVTYTLGRLGGRLEWIEGGGVRPLAYHLAMTLDRDDFAGLGLPLRPDKALKFDAQGVAAGGGFSGQASLGAAEVRYEVAPAEDGERQIALSGSAGDAAFASFGVDVGDYLDGKLDFTGRLVRTSGGAMRGRLESDFSKAALSVPGSGWAKPAGQKAQGVVDLAIGADGAVRLERISADGANLQVRGSGAVSRDGAVSIALSAARMDGFFDGSLQAGQSEQGLDARVSARYLDFRPVLKNLQKSAANGAGAPGEDAPVTRFRADIARVRVSEHGYVDNVALAGSWGPVAQRKAKLTAATERGSAIEVQAFPDNGGTALTLHVADLGDVANALAGYDNLRGGETTGTGRIVKGGYDLDFRVRDMTIIRVPGAAQLVATDGAIFFSRVDAPLQIRGSEVTLGDVVATGPSVGLTARGIMDTRTRKMELVGVVTPAYVLNAAFAGLTGSREGEGVFGVTYRASGAFTDPEIEVNPLSIAVPGVLRRMFEPRTPTFDDR